MPTRALVVALDFAPNSGGIARLLQAWVVEGSDIEWFVITNSKGDQQTGVRRATSRTLLIDLISGMRWLRKADRRVVVAGHPYLAPAAVALAFATRATSTSLAFGSELLASGRKHRIALRALRQVDHVIAISQYTRHLVCDLQVDPAKVRVVNPRLKSPWLASFAPQRAPDQPLQAVALMRLTEGYKNVELLLRLCAVLHPAGVLGQLTIVGTGCRLGALQSKAQELGVADIVVFAGFVPDSEVASVLAQAHVGLFPSRESQAEGGVEGFGLAVHEMAAAGLPVLVGRAGGAIDAAVQPWARLLDPDDLWSWVLALQDLFDNEQQRLALGRAALTWASATSPTESADEFARALVTP